MLKEELASQILAILFAAQEPVAIEQLREVFPDRPAELVDRVVAGLISEFNSWQDSVEVRQVAGGLRMSSRPQHHDVIRSYLKTRPSAKLSLAALETLAVIAYKQPITMAEIMDIRGIKGTSTIRTLLDKRLIQTRGRKKVVGRPMMYGTTREFLVHFGLNDLSELPTLSEFEEILGVQTGAEVREGPVARQLTLVPLTPPSEPATQPPGGEEG
jgi:segregation and condensation protein B